MYSWKWSNGDTTNKSSRQEKQIENDNITNSVFSRNQYVSSKRDQIDNKIADREMIAQRGFNPFLQSSYVNDVVARDMFMKPINTTQVKEKNETTN